MSAPPGPPGSIPPVAGPPSPPPSGTIAGLFEKLLAFIDAPWKAAAVAVLAMVFGFGWIFWDQRERIIDWILTQKEAPAVFDEAALPDAMSKLLAETSADIATAWTVNIDKNAAYFLAGKSRGNGDWTMTPSRLPVIREDDTQLILLVYESRANCVDTASRHGLLAQRLQRENMVWVCFVPIDHFGGIGLAWREQPDDANREAAIGTAREVGRAAMK